MPPWTPPPELLARRRILADERLRSALGRAGQLPADWLDDPAAAADPWILETGRRGGIEHRDAFLGNGWMGQRIAPEGDGRYDIGSRGFCYGLRRDDGRPGGAIRELPRWATLAVVEERPRLHRSCEEIDGYRQALDLRRAVATTEMRRRTPTAGWRERLQVWLPRCEPHLGLLEAEVDPDWGAAPSLQERVDAGPCPDASAVQVAGADRDILVLSMRLGSRALAVATRWLGCESLECVVQRDASGYTRTWRGGRDRRRVAKIAAVVPGDNPAAAATEAARLVAAADPEALRVRHEEAWAGLWARDIVVDHPRLQQVVHAALYQLYASCRAGSAQAIPPCGLSGDGWRGLIFWDSDTWMLPALNLLQPGLARSLVDFRIAGAAGARAEAAGEGMPGASFPWNAADDGRECCTDAVYRAERHVTSSVALGLWQHWLADRDPAYLRRAWPVLRDCARWWAARARPAPASGRWEIRGVCGPDEYGKIQDNSASTNGGAAGTLRIAVAAARAVGEAPDPEWAVVADGLWIPRDAARGVVLQHEGFTDENVVKQADVTLLTHPWQLIVDAPTMRANRDYYRRRTDGYPILMTDAIDGIISCRLGEAEEAWGALRRMLPFLRRPFLGASESPWNEAMCFHTGLGGLLQLVLHGFAGIRLDEGDLDPQPCLPRQVPRLCIQGLRHGGRDWTLDADRAGCRLTPW